MSAPSAADIADALNGRSSGSGYVCECPAHVDLRPSLSVTARDGRVLVHCHAGCTQSAVIGALRRQGLWGDAIVLGSKRDKYNRGHYGHCGRRLTPYLGGGTRPYAVVARAMPFSRGCVADLYLKTEVSTSPTTRRCSLRYSPDLWHWPSRGRWPAMLARVTSASGEELGVHQTFLARDGSAKAPLGDKARLFTAGSRLGVGGGIWFGDARPDPSSSSPKESNTLLSTLRLLGVVGGAPRCRRAGSVGWSYRPA